jgi:hypothetical protein
MRALDDEVRAGRIGCTGISDTPAWVIAQANTIAAWRGWTAFAGLQAPYNLLQRDIERELLPMTEGFGMTVAAWSPLEGGILSGKCLDQLIDNLGSTQVELADEEMAKLDAATAPDLGFPATFIRETSPLGLRCRRPGRRLTWRPADRRQAGRCAALPARNRAARAGRAAVVLKLVSCPLGDGVDLVGD